MGNKTDLSNCFKLTAILGILTTASWGQRAPDDIIELSPYIVSGETYAFGAQKVISVQSEDLEKTIAMDLSDIFTQDPSIKVGGGFGPAQKLYIRGIEDKLLSITVDGATQAGYLSHHHGQYSIEPELLKYVEAEPGAGGAAAGPGALAGSIKFETKAAADFLKDDQQYGLFTKAIYSDNADEWKLTAAGYGQVTDNFAVIAAYSYSESGDYEDGNGNIIDYTGSDKARVFLRVDGSINDRHSYGFSHEETFEKGAFRHRPNFYGYFNHPIAPNVPVEMDIGRLTSTVDYGFTPSDLNIEGSVKIYNTEFLIDRPSQYEMGYESFGVDVDAKSVFGDHKVLYGFDYRDDSASFTGKGQAVGFAAPLVYQTIPDETIDITGVYIQDDWQINDLLQLSFGARLDEYDYEDKDGKSFKESGFSPNVGLSYEVTEELDLNVSFGSAFRGVTPIDLITANEGGVTNDDDIDGETSKNLEIGFQYDNGTFFANGTIYQQKIEDVITSSGVRDNGGELEVNGYDFSFGAKRGSISGSLGVSDSDPELNGEALIDAANGIGVGSGRTWNANVDYLVADLNVSLGWNLNFTEAYEESDEVLAHKDSYTVHDVYVRWISKEIEGVVVTLALSNLFDEFYVDQATAGYNSRLQQVAGLPEAGRAFKLSVAYQF